MPATAHLVFRGPVCWLFAALFCFLLCGAPYAALAQEGPPPPKPENNESGEDLDDAAVREMMHGIQRAKSPNVIIRLGYCEDGPSPTFADQLFSFVNILNRRGLADIPEPPPEARVSSRILWDWLSENDADGPIQFVQDAFYTSNWDREEMFSASSKLSRRLEMEQDLDLLLLFGSWLGKNINSLPFAPPVMNLTERSPEDRFHKGVEARQDYFMNYEFFYSQNLRDSLLLFRNYMHFDTLAFMGEPADPGLAKVLHVLTTNLPISNKVVEVPGSVRLLHCPDAYTNEECLQFILDRADAVYMFDDPKFTDDERQKMFAAFTRAGIPTFSAAGAKDVHLGALMGPAAVNERFKAKRYAVMLNRLLRHVGSLRVMHVELPIRLSMNLDTAEGLSFNPCEDLLLLCDTLHSARSRSHMEKWLQKAGVEGVTAQETPAQGMAE